MRKTSKKKKNMSGKNKRKAEDEEPEEDLEVSDEGDEFHEDPKLYSILPTFIKKPIFCHYFLNISLFFFLKKKKKNKKNYLIIVANMIFLIQFKILKGKRNQSLRKLRRIKRF